MKYLIVYEDGSTKQSDHLTNEDRVGVDQATLDIFRYEDGDFEILSVGLCEAEADDDGDYGDDTFEVNGTYYTNDGDNWAPA